MAYEPPKNGFRTFVIVWATQSVSVIGSALTWFAMTIWLTEVLYPGAEQKQELALALSAVGLAFALPMILVTPIAGAWADRHDRKRTMMAMDFISGCASLLLAFLMVSQMLQLELLLALIVVIALVSAFHQSAFDTAYAMLVPERQLPRANGMMQTIWALSGIISPAIAATLIALPAFARQGLGPGAVGAALGNMSDGTPLAITIDAITFFLAAGALLLLFIPSPKRMDLRTADGAMKKSIWADVQEGARYIWYRRPLLWLLGTFCMANLLMAPFGTLRPLLVKFNLADDWMALGFTFETALALLGSLAGVGGLIGGVAVSAWGGLRRKRVFGVLAGIMGGGLALSVIGLSSSLYLTVAAAFLMASMMPVANVHSQAIWQTQTPRELQGRVFAVRRVIATFSAPLGTVFAGVAGGLFDPGLVIAVLGSLIVLLCILQFFNPYLLRVEDKEWLDAIAARQVMEAAPPP